MKLYATTTSERASKGQGGNRFINIDLLVGDVHNQIDAGRVSMKTTGDVFWIEYFAPHTPGQSIKRIELFQTEKGEKQKGDTIHDDGDYDINPCHCGQGDCPSNQ